jgi:14-3-3 protein epsilon
MTNIEESIYLARVAEQSERYEDMVEFLQTLGDKDGELTPDERNLLSVAYKNMVGTRRSAWRAISAIAQNPKYEKFHTANRNYRKRIEGEMSDMCNQIVKLIDEKLFPKTSDVESQVFYHKMKGDYFRYLSEVVKDAELKVSSERALVAYKEALERSATLNAAHPIKLGLVLNFSVFNYEIMSDKKKACDLAKATFDEAINGLDSMDEHQYKEAASILQLLRDNLTLWTAELDEDRGVNTDKESAGEIIDL